jgi:hypothetical protein
MWNALCFGIDERCALAVLDCRRRIARRHGVGIGVSRSEVIVPEKRTIKAARQAKREGKSPSTQAGEFVHEEITHIREGKHGARSAKQAIAIGLAKARRAGVDLAPPAKGTTSEGTRAQATRDVARGHSGSTAAPSPKRSRASTRRLEREGTAAVSHLALSRQAKKAARTRERRGATTATSTRKTTARAAKKR